MAWLILLVSGVLESVWATALSESDGLRRRGWTAVFAVALMLSMAGLALAMREIPTGTAYAVWVGIGAALTAVVAFVRGTERATLLRVALLVVLVGCVAGLKLIGGEH